MVTSQAHQLRQRASGARTLYLGGQGAKHVTCTDEALVVRNEARQTMRYPIGRISRVVSGPNADWTGSALALCMRQSISITWVSPQGQALGGCVPHQRHYSSSASAVEQLTETESGHQRYQHWLRQRRMDTLVRWARGQSEKIPPTIWETAKRQWVYGGRLSVGIHPGLHAHCQAHVHQQLTEHGLPSQLWGPKAEPIPLDHDLAHLLWGDMNISSGAIAHQVSDQATSIRFFEHWIGHNATSLQAHVYSLIRLAFKYLHSTDTP